MMRFPFRLLLLTVLLTAIVTPLAAQELYCSTLRGSAGITGAGNAGANAEVSFPLIPGEADDEGQTKPGTELCATVSSALLPGGDSQPCPSGECPDIGLNIGLRFSRGWDWIPHVTMSVRLPLTTRVSLVPSFGAGAAVGTASLRSNTDPRAALKALGAPDAETEFPAESRTAATLVYGLALDYRLTLRVSVFGQYRGFSIFTGERELSGPDGPLVIDVGTENRSLFSAGLGYRF